MKNQTSYTILGIAGLVVLVAAISALKPKDMDWSLSFDRYKKDPFGTYILGQNLKDLFPNNRLMTSREQYGEKEIVQTISETEDFSTEQFSEDEKIEKNVAENPNPFLNYLFLGDDFSYKMAEIKPFDYGQLVSLAQSGNVVFIATEKFPSELQNLLQFSTSQSELANLHREIYQTKSRKVKPTTVKFVNPAFTRKSIELEDIAVSTKFTNFPISQTKVLATNQDGCPVLIKIQAGKGAFILSSTPLAFTNYYLMKFDGKEFVANVMSYLPNQDIVWDEYYKFNAPIKDDHRSDRILRYIFSQPSLAWAFWLAVALTMIYALFEMKRRQRIIPEMAKPKNYSLEFAETIGQLYYKSQNHKNIAEKQIRSFLDHIRSRYYLSTKEFDTQFMEILAAKSGVTPSAISEIFDQIKRIKRSEQILENDLIEFSNKIETFYATAK